MTQNADSVSRRIVFFDGVCLLCERSVRFLLDRDGERRLCFATLQGETARALLGEETASALDSLVYVVEDEEGIHRYERSHAALRILRDLGGIWRMVAWLRIVPRPLRDAVYRVIAANRYQWFGKKDECGVPAADESDRFLP